MDSEENVSELGVSAVVVTVTGRCRLRQRLIVVGTKAVVLVLVEQRRRQGRTEGVGVNDRLGIRRLMSTASVVLDRIRNMQGRQSSSWRRRRRRRAKQDGRTGGGGGECGKRCRPAIRIGYLKAKSRAKIGVLCCYKKWDQIM